MKDQCLIRSYDITIQTSSLISIILKTMDQKTKWDINIRIYPQIPETLGGGETFDDVLCCSIST